MTQANNRFQAPLATAFTGAMMGGVLTELVIKGFRGMPPGTRYDFVDSIIGAFQGGISYISYQAAIDTISIFSVKFKEIKEDPKKKGQMLVYLSGGTLAALMATGINYPLQCFRDYRTSLIRFQKMQKTNKNAIVPAYHFSLKEAENYFTDRVFAYIGFATSMGCIIPTLNKPKSTIHKWAQTHYLLQMSHLNGVLVAYPYNFFRNNTSLIPYLEEHFKSITRRMISSDFSCYFKRMLAGIPYMSV